MRFLKLLGVKSITGKIISYLLLVVLGIFTVLGIFIYLNVGNVIQSEVIKSETQLISTVSTGIEDSLYGAIDETVVTFQDPMISQIMSSKKSKIGSAEQKQLQEFIFHKMDFNKNISSISVSNGIYSFKYPKGNDNINDAQIREYMNGKNLTNTIDTGDRGVILCEINTDEKTTGGKTGEQRFVVIRPERNGFVAIILKNDFLKDIESKYDHFVICKDKEYIIYDIVGSKDTKNLSGKKENKISSSEYFNLTGMEDNSWNKINNYNGYIYKKHFYSINANFFCTLSKNNIENQFGKIAGFIIVTFTIGTICFLIISLLVLHGLNRPLKELKDFIDSVDVHDKIMQKLYTKNVGFFRFVTGSIKLKNKLYFVLVCCTIIPIIIVTYFAYNRSSSIIADRIDQNTLHTVEIASSNVGNVVDSYKRLTKNVMNNLTIQKFIINENLKGKATIPGNIKGTDSTTGGGNSGAPGGPGGPGNDISYLVLREQVSTLKFVNVVLCNNDKKMIYSMIPQQMVDGTKQLLESNKIDSSSGKPIWTDVTYDRAWDYTYSILWEIRGSYSEIEYGKKLGYVVSTFTLQDIEKIFEGILRETHGDVYIIGSNNKYVMNTNRSKINTTADIKLIKKAGDNADAFYYNEDKSRTTTYVARIPEINWKVVAEVPKSEIYSQTRMIYISSLFILLVCILLILFISRKIANYFVNKIIQLEVVMKNVEAGDLSSRYQQSAGDEIESLGESFNKMLGKIQELVQELATAGIKEKELESQRNLAELKALHAQINPHFLYNTLESINSLAIIKGMNEVSEMAISLGNMFRFSVKSGNKFVLFKEEINHVTNYLKIQKIRYSDLFIYKIDIDPEIYKYNCVKLILQPIVENALYHGVEKKGENGVITIKGEIVKGKIRISVTDNGAGIKKDKLEELNQKLDEAVIDNNYGIGLFNVNRRIKLYYNNEYGLKIFSIEGEETKVEIWLPCVYENS